jgi:hypothetical protein
MGWGSKVQIEIAADVAGTELFSDTVTLNSGELSQIQIKANSGGTTDSLVISIYASLDDDVATIDTVPTFSFVLDCTNGNDNIVSFFVSGPFAYRVGYVRDGSTDTIVTDAWVRKDGVNL